MRSTKKISWGKQNDVVSSIHLTGPPQTFDFCKFHVSKNNLKTYYYLKQTPIKDFLFSLQNLSLSLWLFYVNSGKCLDTEY